MCSLMQMPVTHGTSAVEAGLLLAAHGAYELPLLQCPAPVVDAIPRPLLVAAEAKAALAGGAAQGVALAPAPEAVGVPLAACARANPCRLKTFAPEGGPNAANARRTKARGTDRVINMNYSEQSAADLKQKPLQTAPSSFPAHKTGANAHNRGSGAHQVGAVCHGSVMCPWQCLHEGVQGQHPHQAAASAACQGQGPCARWLAHCA